MKMNYYYDYYHCIWVCFLILAFNNGVAEGSHKRNPGFDSIHALAPVSKLLRTAFHFQPLQHWINDPNGPMYYNGVYHFFYQYNPKGSVWGNIVWAHSVSTDMINWQSVDPALYPSKPFDIEGCWSGSATILPGTGPAILYTGLDPHLNQVQNIALPANLSDPYLRAWVKPDYNPLVVPSPEMNTSCFRDPTTAWYSDGHWKMLVGGRKHRSGVVYLYRSKDFKRWLKAKHPLHAGQNMGMWECPDFYPVSVAGQDGLDTSAVRPTVPAGGEKYVLKVSLDKTRYDYYTVGRYDKSIDKYFPDNPSLDGWNGLRYDYGNFYASKTFFDPKKNRRVLWGWANESDAKPMDVQKGWAGIQAIPRRVWLDPSKNQLLQWPIEELETLRRNPVQLKNQNIYKGHLLEIKGVTAAQADVEVVFTLPSSLETAEAFDPKWVDAQALCSQKGSSVEGGVGPFGLLTLASVGLEEYTPVFFRVFKAHSNNNHVVLLCSDASRSSLISNRGMYKPSFAGFVDVDLKDRQLSLRSLIDHSVVESFGAQGKTCITSRVYPTKAVFNRAHLYVFNNGTSPVTVETLDAWSMASPAKMNQPLA